MEHFDPEEAIARVQREFGEHGGVCPSISRSSTFTVMTPETMPEIFKGVRGPDQGGCYLYSRHFNPTVDVLARYLAAMENTEYAICTASGMAAIACTLLQLCRQGDHIVASRTIYGGTHALLADLLALPFIYIRDKPKGHGLKNRIEGIDAESDLGCRRVVVKYMLPGI